MATRIGGIQMAEDKITRRQFIQRTAVVGAGLVGAGIVGLSGCRDKTEAGPTFECWQRDESNLAQAAPAIDPQLFAYREIKQVETGLAKPRGLALGPDGRLHVVGDQVIHIFDEDSASPSTMGLGSAPQALAVASDGTIYIAMLDHIEVYVPDGTHRASWQSAGERAYFTSVAVAGEDVWVADAGGRVVLRYDKAGQVRGRIGEKDEAKGVPGIVVPSPHLNVLVGPDGLIWVNNPGRRAVETYTVEGDLISSWGHSSLDLEGFCGCCNPTDIALLPDGKIVTSEKGLPRVKVHWPDGTLESVVAGPEAFAPRVVGLELVVDAAGRVMVLDPATKTVRIFERREKIQA